MYISCVDDGVAVEAEMGYVPNNPLFGLPLDSPQVNFVSTVFSLPTTRSTLHRQRTKKKKLLLYGIRAKSFSLCIHRIVEFIKIFCKTQECSPTCGGCINCQGNSSISVQTLRGSDFDCGNCLDHNDILRYGPVHVEMIVFVEWIGWDPHEWVSRWKRYWICAYNKYFWCSEIHCECENGETNWK